MKSHFISHKRSSLSVMTSLPHRKTAVVMKNNPIVQKHNGIIMGIVLGFILRHPYFFAFGSLSSTV